jgi:hypothetical protein
MRVRIVVFAVILIAVLAVAFVLISGWMFDARISALRDELIASQEATGAPSVELPAMVRDYALRAGGTVGGPTAVHARHEATFATAIGAAPLMMHAEQWTGTAVPGIVWKARGSMFALPVTVFDSYVDGRGELAARVLGTFQVAGGSGPDYDKGELMRYLSELPVHPDAILNTAGLAWRQLDASTVEVSADSGAGPARIRFMFDAAGDIVRMEADDRPMSADGAAAVPTPWHGIYGDYRKFGRYRIPAYGEVGWVLESGLFTYWHGRLTAYEPLN